MRHNLPQDLIDAVATIVKEETEYQKFFKSVLKKFGVTSPKELTGDKEKEFYDYIDANWEGKTETDEETDSGEEEVEEVRKYKAPTAAEIKKDKEKDQGKGDRMYGAMRGGLKKG